jgi:sec-independent protein translocase protein TatC
MSKRNIGKMPLIEHLSEFRKRLIRSVIAISLASIGGWFLYDRIITQLAKPVCDLAAARATGSDACGSLYINGILGPLNLQIKVAVLSGLIVAAPIWLFQLWAFIAPALHRKEKRYSILFLVAATPFFAIGATIGYLILPLAIKVLFGFTPNALTNLVKFDDYLDFVLRMILLFGLAFELPVFLLTFNLIGFLRGATILKPWRIWVFAITLAAAALTPTSDPITMSILAIPLIFLYFIAGLIALLLDRRRDKRKQSQDLTDFDPSASPID